MYSAIIIYLFYIYTIDYICLKVILETLTLILSCKSISNQNILSQYFTSANEQVYSYITWLCDGSNRDVPAYIFSGVKFV